MFGHCCFRNLTLIFGPGESRLVLSIAILDDSLPEVDEDFLVALGSPSGGARLGAQTTVGVVVLTNDDAHGVVGFSEGSLSIVVLEANTDAKVVLHVERSSGTFSQVTVGWELTGAHDAGEITPSAGQVGKVYCFVMIYYA